LTATTEEPIRRRRFNVADYHRMGETGILSEDDRVELIDGEIIEMTPIGSPHGGRVKQLNYLLTRAVGEHAIVAPQDPVILDDRSEPEPDLALFRRGDSGGRACSARNGSRLSSSPRSPPLASRRLLDLDRQAPS
jgi:Uma2 family endonuclease